MEVKDLIHENTLASIKTVIWLCDHGRSEAAASRALRGHLVRFDGQRKRVQHSVGKKVPSINRRT
jgi:hypothetical protein